jgi:transcriptional regulator with XRE-family HTH domain
VPNDSLRGVISSQVARLLKAERERRGISLNLLAEKAGLSRQTISYVEQEVQSPTLETLLRITWALEVDLEKIIARARKLASAKLK